MSSIPKSRYVTSVSWIRRILYYAIALIIGFLIGFVPMWVKSRASASGLSEATNRANLAQTQSSLASAAAAQKLELAVMQNTLASAAIDAQRGDYESARQAASSFFTSLRTEVSKGDDSGFSQAQMDGVEAVFTRRDEIISLLARNDPAATERLSDVYVSFRELMSE